MSGDLSKTGLDRKLISLEEVHEMRSWTQSLGCTEAELRAAVKAVGNSAEAVREHLAGRKKPYRTPQCHASKRAGSPASQAAR